MDDTLVMEKTEKRVHPVLYSLPITAKLKLPPRAELLPKIESGELEYLDFTAKVFGTGRNYNPYLFRDEDLAAFAASFEGKPYLRNHDTDDIDARDGTILSSRLEDGAFLMEIRLTTRRGMISYIEGQIDRFSIGWYYDDIFCSICKTSWFNVSCPHFPGVKYTTPEGEQECKLIFINPRGKEVSAVNSPAVENTGIIPPELQEYKLALAAPPPIPPQMESTFREGRKEEGEEVKEDIIGGDETLTPDPSPVNGRGEVEMVVTAEDSTPEGGQAPDDPVEEHPEEMAQARQAFHERQLAIAETFIWEGDPIMNVREKMAERAALIARARELANLADAEHRDFTEEERAEYEGIMGVGDQPGKVDTLATEITQIAAERAKLADAEASLETPAVGSEPIKPESSVDPLKKTKAEFDALSAKEKMAFAKAKGKIIEG